MKLIALLLAASGLTGCVAYPYGPAPEYYGQGYYSPAVPYVLHQPVSVYATSGYGWWRPGLQPDHRADRFGRQVDRQDERRDRRDASRDPRTRNADGRPGRRDHDRDGGSHRGDRSQVEGGRH